MLMWNYYILAAEFVLKNGPTMIGNGMTTVASPSEARATPTTIVVGVIMNAQQTEGHVASLPDMDLVMMIPSAAMGFSVKGTETFPPAGIHLHHQESIR